MKKHGKFFLFAVLLAIIVSGCATWNRTFFSKDLVLLSIGMDKQAVIEHINKPQNIVLAKQTKNGLIEVFEYVEKPFYMGRANKAFWTSYWVYFRDGKLAGYERAVAVNERKRLDRLEQIAAFNAMKGTPLMPIQHNIEVDGEIQQNINIKGDIQHNIDGRLDIYKHDRY